LDWGFFKELENKLMENIEEEVNIDTGVIINLSKNFAML